jgi:hypothetical protein
MAGGTLTASGKSEKADIRFRSSDDQKGSGTVDSPDDQDEQSYCTASGGNRPEPVIRVT